MPTLLSARSRARNIRGGDANADADGRAGGGNRACYGIAACAVALLLFCALAVSVHLWMAFVFGGLALVAFGAAGCLARGPSRSTDGGEMEAADAAAAARTQRRFGLPKAAINALPTFAYELSAGGAEGGDGGDLESGTAAAAGGEPCSVCLEDFQAGETVRQLPACKHVFHVGCIDMWLHSHRTCPVCRCNLLPAPVKVAAKAAHAPAPAPAPTAEAAEPPSADDALPPV